MRAQVVVIGAGVGGASVAYHLARLGVTDVLVLEQHRATEGTTWHSAGFVGVLRSSVTQTRMIMYSSGLYAELERATGRDAGWRGVGGLRVATTPERVQELQRAARSATTYGLDLQLLSAAEAQQRAPLLDVSDVLGASWLAADGYLDPDLLAGALLDGARGLGVTLREHTRVTGIDVRAGRVCGLQTSAGPVEAETVVVCAGAASGVVGAMAGAVIPVVPMRHQYVVTEPFGVDSQMPTVRDPDHITYFRPHEGGLLVGGYSRSPATWDAPDPLAEPKTLFAADPESFAESWDGARRRVPALDDVPIANVVHGPEAFTPDGEFLLGETEVGGLWTACGFCVHGLAGAGGVGKLTAEWIVDGRPELDVSAMDVRRFGAHARSRAWATARALESYARYYDVVFPGEERQAGRPLRTAPTYARLASLGASFGEKAGWERANWFASNAGEDRPPRGWAGRNWSPAIAAECRATRDRVALFDQSSFAKIDVGGPGAVAALDALCANDVTRAVGRAVYTQMLNPAGGVEADLTVTRTGEQSFRVVTGTASARRDLDWITRHLPRDATAIDVSGARACLCLWGPRARDVLQPICEDDLGSEAFGYLDAREVTVGGVPVFAQRITFVGELGWELYCPAEYGMALWDAVWAAGRPHGLVAGGYRAIDSMRLEKGYRVWGSDVTPVTTPDEAGLGFAVRSPHPFIGRDALGARPARRLRVLVLDDGDVVCLGDEPVIVDGEPAGRVTSGGIGYRTQTSIAYAMLPAELGDGDRVEVGVFDQVVGARIADRPVYDPAGERIRA